MSGVQCMDGNWNYFIIIIINDYSDFYDLDIEILFQLFNKNRL